jgi:hypothetical protein
MKDESGGIRVPDSSFILHPSSFPNPPDFLPSVGKIAQVDTRTP